MRKSTFGTGKSSLITRHWRLIAGVLTGLLGWVFAGQINLPESTHILIGWDVGAAIYGILLWRLFLTADEATLRAKAAEEDEGRSLILLIVLSAIAASLAAVVAAMIGARSQAAFARNLTAACAGVTLVLSWIVLHSVFVLHYAHRHFGGGAGKGGFGFPGEPARTYKDFVYLAFSIGATFQVSDNDVRTGALRNLVTAHAVTAYFYNTAILALGINIIAGVVAG
ncbi:DUF1345 domain-containing protein [Caulobacter sp. 602-2]|uniref:DUF1345 domain-containing protein n=1 Tax=Caulobacter sp. 602-2 TaxID=2710887 RepID=A0A6G4R0F5_9CAUL|nr:DUF1345 domain-containing protein [Caulobacter sp. 602-2]